MLRKLNLRKKLQGKLTLGKSHDILRNQADFHNYLGTEINKYFN